MSDSTPEATAGNALRNRLLEFAGMVQACETDAEVVALVERVLPVLRDAAGPELAWLPPHDAALRLDHNNHLTAGVRVDLLHVNRHGTYRWVSPEEQQRAVVTNESWLLHWSVQAEPGYRGLVASSLKALEAACRAEFHGEQGP